VLLADTRREYYSLSLPPILAVMDWTERMEQRRQAMGFTQERLSEKLGITVGAYQHWLSGRRRPKTVDTFTRIAEVLHCSTPWLMFGVETPSDPRTAHILEIAQQLADYQLDVLADVADSLVKKRAANDG
jgi:transcriptional regulator with XRE-family HTH domain